MKTRLAIALLALVVVAMAASGCSGQQSPAPSAGSTRAPARHLILVTIDTLRADRLGAYGYPRARTPRIDALAARGVRFDHAFATAPITLPSHASLLTGRYPPGHGSRHNGMRIADNTLTLAAVLQHAGFTTGGFVAAFPLDRRFGLDKGFATYGDHLPRDAQGRLQNERPGREVVSDAIGWLDAHRRARLFLWVHLFEPHAPYGDPRSGRSASDRYDDEVAEADVQVGRLVDALGPDAAASLIVVASDHGEAFGEHGEVAHSLFVYDTTLRVPLVMTGPGLLQRVVSGQASLVDVVPTVLPLLGVPAMDVDGLDLSPSFSLNGGGALPERDLYAESFAPLFDFGWSPLGAIRSGGFKFIEAPTPELYDMTSDPGELQDLSKQQAQRVADMRERVKRFASTTPVNAARDRETLGRLQALGYMSGRGAASGSDRPDPKDRRDLAAEMSRVTSGELAGTGLERTLRKILQEDPRNPQANLRLGYVLLESRRCADATRYFSTAIAGQLPSADAHLGLATCQAIARRFGEAAATLQAAEQIEPGNSVVLANLGMMLSDGGRHAEGVAPLQRALAIDPDFHEARFNLARVFARSGRRADAAREARDLLARLPANSPQRGEVERLLRAVE